MVSLGAARRVSAGMVRTEWLALARLGMAGLASLPLTDMRVINGRVENLRRF